MTQIDDILQALKENAEQRDNRIAALEATLGNAKATLADESIAANSSLLTPNSLPNDRLATIEEALATLLEDRTQPTTAAQSGSTWTSVLFRLLWLALILLALWACLPYVTNGVPKPTPADKLPPVTLQEKSLIDGAVNVVTADIQAGAITAVPDARLGLLASLPPSMPAREPFVTAVDSEQAEQTNPNDVAVYPNSMQNVVQTLVIDDTVKKKRVILPPPLPPADSQPSEPPTLPPAILPEPPRLMQEPPPRPQPTNRRSLFKQRLQRFLNR